jgi:hypothetical protein
VLLAGGVLIGIGAGCVNPSVAAAAIGTVPVAKSGMASGLNSTFRLLGVAVGVALLGAILERQVASSMAASLGSAPHDLVDLVASGNIQLAAGQAVDPAVAAAAESAFVSGFDAIQLVAALIAFAGAALSFALVRQRDFVAQARAGVAAPATA